MLRRLVRADVAVAQAVNVAVAHLNKIRVDFFPHKIFFRTLHLSRVEELRRDLAALPAPRRLVGPVLAVVVAVAEPGAKRVSHTKCYKLFPQQTILNFSKNSLCVAEAHPVPAQELVRATLAVGRVDTAGGEVGKQSQNLHPKDKKPFLPAAVAVRSSNGPNYVGRIRSNLSFKVIKRSKKQIA